MRVVVSVTHGISNHIFCQDFTVRSSVYQINLKPKIKVKIIIIIIIIIN